MTATGPATLAQAAVGTALSAMEGVPLAAVTTAADLQTRVDRKYLLPPPAFTELARALEHDGLVLDIDGRRSFTYESTYFDTADRQSYRGAAHGRRRRFKIRTRTYTDSGSCVLEIKTTGGRGETIKLRWPYDPDQRGVLTDEAVLLVDESLGRTGLGSSLEAALTTTYRRSTVVGRAADFRLTVDTGVVCAGPDGATVTLTDLVLVETKSRSAPTRPDRVLWTAGHRPVRISKYCVGLAALDPQLPANRWHRTLRQHLQVR